jgi:hypothetical protein
VFPTLLPGTHSCRDTVLLRQGWVCWKWWNATSLGAEEIFPGEEMFEPESESEARGEIFRNVEWMCKGPKVGSSWKWKRTREVEHWNKKRGREEEDQTCRTLGTMMSSFFRNVIFYKWQKKSKVSWDMRAFVVYLAELKRSQSLDWSGGSWAHEIKSLGKEPSYFLPSHTQKCVDFHPWCVIHGSRTAAAWSVRCSDNFIQMQEGKRENSRASTFVPCLPSSPLAGFFLGLIGQAGSRDCPHCKGTKIPSFQESRLISKCWGGQGRANHQWLLQWRLCSSSWEL